MQLLSGAFAGEGRAMPLPYPSISLSDFELLDTLGTGSFGRVRLVKFLNAPAAKPTYYALKILKKSEVIYLKQVDHVKTEKKILEELNHLCDGDCVLVVLIKDAMALRDCEAPLWLGSLAEVQLARFLPQAVHNTP